jgi:hypothetical protein
MKRFLQLAALVTFTLAFTSMAQAQASRTWVSGVGDDANPCSRTAPCKTFAGAISKTAACGEIDALDPGGFGAVTITKAITIDGSGTFASILASLVNGVVINATGDVNAVITLRGLSINGFCNGLDGVRILAAKRVNLEDMVIFKMAGDGIEATDSDGLGVHMRNVVVRDNGEDGIEANSTTQLQEWSIQSCSFNGNTNGLHAKNQTRFNVRNSVFADNSQDGLLVECPTSGQFAVVNISDSQITLNNSDGIQVGNAGNLGGAFVRFSNNQITNNSGNGVNETTGGNLETFSNNFIKGNSSDACTGCSPIGPGL